jgi:hypothetical protein
MTIARFPIAVLLSFAAALVAFLLLRGAEPLPARGDAARAVTARIAGDTDAQIARLQAGVRAAPRAAAPRVDLAAAYLQKARETGDPGLYARARATRARSSRARGSRSPATTSGAAWRSPGVRAPRSRPRWPRIPRWSTRSSSSAASAPPSARSSG